MSPGRGYCKVAVPRHQPSAPRPLDGDHEISLDGDHEIFSEGRLFKAKVRHEAAAAAVVGMEGSSTVCTSVGATMLEGEGRPLRHQPRVEALFRCPCRRRGRSHADPLRYALACCLVQPPGGNSLAHQRQTEGFLSRRAFVGRKRSFTGGAQSLAVVVFLWGGRKVGVSTVQIRGRRSTRKINHKYREPTNKGLRRRVFVGLFFDSAHQPRESRCRWRRGEGVSYYAWR